jgi:NhaP-type Na+/H+ or K+/H+ antiporter
MLLCECAKSVVKKNNIHWLPESAACMLVGIGMAGLTLLAGYSMEQFAFDEEIFMFILLPPIIFEAALTVNKREFRRRRGAIIVFAVFGTIMSSFVTGMATYYAAKYLGHNSLTMLDSLVFGSLISSIDPVAILSVLTSLNMSETDTIYIIVLGESLLNDGIAITLFKSLIQSYQTNAAVTTDGLLGSIADFVIIASGSFAIGLACGFASLFFFLLNKSILHPVMEVASFFVWAVVPYWLAEAFSWSGIVAIVVMGFFMDMYLRPGWDPAELQQEEEQQERINRLMKLALAEQEKTNAIDSPCENMYYKWGDGENKFRFRGSAVDIPKPGFEASYKPVNNGGNAVDTTKPSPNHPHPLINEAAPFDGQMPNSFEATSDSDGMDETIGGVSSANVKAIILKREFVRLSREADEHVRFVAHILSSLSENAIFAYLGLFLFSSKYKWNALLCTIGTISCIFSRAVMVIAATRLIWYIHVFRQRAGCDSKANTSLCIEPDETNESEDGEKLDPLQTPVSKSARALSNYKVQVVLILAGLRGAVSLALVESVPIYNGVTGVGCKHKGLLKAMTSSAIIFSIFVLGGGAWYILKRLDISDEEMLIQSNEKDRGETFLSTGFDCGVRTTQEMELATAPSWRVETAPSWRNHDHRLSISVSGSYSGSTSNFLNTPSPSQVPRSRSERSDWPRVSDNTGLML